MKRLRLRQPFTIRPTPDGDVLVCDVVGVNASVVQEGLHVRWYMYDAVSGAVGHQGLFALDADELDEKVLAAAKTVQTAALEMLASQVGSLLTGRVEDV